MLARAIAHELRKRRKQGPLQQGELAQRLGVSQSVLCRYESATLEPSVPFFCAWCAALKVQPGDVLQAAQRRAHVLALVLEQQR